MSPGPYRVIWRRSLLEYRIGEIILELRARGEGSEPLFEAIDRINELLATRPEARGESRAAAERVLHVPPLTVTFEVHPDDRIVFVVRARYVRPRHGRG